MRLKNEIENLHVIHIKRSNYLSVYLSKIIARKTGEWVKYVDKFTNDANLIRNAPIKNLLTFKISPEDTKYFFDSMKKVDEFLNRHFEGDKYIDVIYEQISISLEREANRLFKYLGLPNQKVKPLTQKQVTRMPNEIIENYAELKSYFARSKYQNYFTI
jgi:LPS sulfotransferase NodH